MIWDPERVYPPVFITEDVMGFLKQSVLSFDMETVKDVIEGVSSALKDYPELAEDNDTTFLIIKAFTAVGEFQIARRMLLYTYGFVKICEWDIAGDDEILVIDLNRLKERYDIFIDLVLVKIVDIILESISYRLDKTDGRGIIGLKVGNSNITKKFLMDVCISRLWFIAREREWKDIPQVIFIEL